jgi:hypothetical protein
MNVVIVVVTALLMVMAATGIYNLQWWLERNDYRRHFED